MTISRENIISENTVDLNKSLVLLFAMLITIFEYVVDNKRDSRIEKHKAKMSKHLVQFVCCQAASGIEIDKKLYDGTFLILFT